MACPHFYPLAPLSGDPWARGDYRWPLMLPHTGVCRLTDGQPDPAALEGCNAGYARGRCAHLRPEDPDAVRFTVLAAAAAAAADDQGDGEVELELEYSLEKEHWPVEHGRLRWSWAAAQVSGAPNPVLARQAEAFLAGYRARAAAGAVPAPSGPGPLFAALAEGGRR